MGDGFEIGGLGMGPWWVFALLLLAGVALLVVVRAARGGVGDAAPGGGGADRPSRARAILEEGYARGEISGEEYWD